MSRLAPISSRRLCTLLEHLGFEQIRQRGSHAYFRHPDGRSTVVPMHRGEDIGRGLLRAILRDIELSVERYERVRRQVR